MAVDKCSRYRVDVDEDQVEAAKYGAQTGLTEFAHSSQILKMSTQAIGQSPNDYGEAEGLDMFPSLKRIYMLHVKGVWQMSQLPSTRQ